MFIFINFVILIVASNFVQFVELVYVPPADFCDKYYTYKQMSPFNEMNSIKAMCEPKAKPPHVPTFCNAKNARAQAWDPNSHRNCGSFFLDHLFDEDLIAYILEINNSFRNMVACGKKWILNAKGDRLETARSMYKLRWSEQLEWTIQPMLRSCFWSHDGCILTPDISWVGQNILTHPINEKGIDPPLEPYDIKRRMVEGWAYMMYEIFAADFNSIKKFENNDPMNIPGIDDKINDALKTTWDDLPYQRDCPEEKECWKKRMKGVGHVFETLQSTTFRHKDLNKKQKAQFKENFYIRGKLMGCTAVYCAKNKTHRRGHTYIKYFLNYGCNYDDRYWPSNPIFKYGPPASDCAYGKKSKIYCCLCLDKDDHSEDHLTEDYCVNPMKSTFPWPDTKSFLKTEAERSKMGKEEAEAEKEWFLYFF